MISFFFLEFFYGRAMAIYFVTIKMVRKDLNCFFFLPISSSSAILPPIRPPASAPRGDVSVASSERRPEPSSIASLPWHLSLSSWPLQHCMTYCKVLGGSTEKLGSKNSELRKYLKMGNTWNLWKKLGVLSQDSSFSFCLSNFSAFFCCM